ncbi:MAG TPA: nucleotide exchange factor GrpE [Opitutaceae bacterium]|nr:nucleotide exchange factor GrpE [Opitutaceae bacterium]
MTDSTPADSPTNSPPAAGAAPASAGSAAPAEKPAGPSPEEQLATAKKEAADNYHRYLRAVADLENYRKRTVREKDELRQYAATRVLEDLLPVLDNLALGLAAAKQTGAEMKGLIGGVEMVMTQLKAALANHGLVEINPAGQAFDPHRHQAISHQPSADIPAEHVLTVVRPGYTLNGRLLRPASVIVSSGAVKGAAK